MNKRFTLMMGILLLSIQFAFAQKFNITAKVVDADTKEPLIGVNAILEGTGLGAASDLDGKVAFHQ